MTDATRDYPHLNDAASALIGATDAERIKSIQSGTWLGYGRVKEILARLEELLEYLTAKPPFWSASWSCIRSTWMRHRR
jgi:hypothetical protein